MDQVLAVVLQVHPFPRRIGGIRGRALAAQPVGAGFEIHGFSKGVTVEPRAFAALFCVGQFQGFKTLPLPGRSVFARIAVLRERGYDAETLATRFSGERADGDGGEEPEVSDAAPTAVARRDDSCAVRFRDSAVA